MTRLDLTKLKLVSDKREVTSVFLVSLLAVFIFFLPVIYAGVITPKGFVFSGFHSLFDPTDINAYLDYIRQGREGNFLSEDFQTYENTRAKAPIHLFYIFLGHLGRLSGTTDLTVYYLATVTVTVITILFLYYLVKSLFKDRVLVWTTFLLTIFGGGLSLYNFPDFNFFQTLYFPHVIADQLLLLLILFFGARSVANKSWKDSLFIAFLGLLLSFIHPYMLFLTIAVLSVYFFSVHFYFRKGVSSAVYLVPIIAVAVFSYIFFSNQFKSLNILSVATSNPFSPPTFFNLFTMYFPLSLTALFGLIVFAKEKTKTKENLLIVSWVFTQLLILYLPFSFARLFIKGFFIALCFSSGYFFLYLINRNHKIFWVVLSFVFLLSVGGQFFFQYKKMEIAKGGGFGFTYLSIFEKDALDYLKKTPNDSGPILSSASIGSFIPRLTGKRSFYGHFFVDRGTYEEHPTVLKFLNAGLSESEAKDFILKNNIAYIYYGVRERLSGGMSWDYLNFLQPIFQEGDVVIFNVKK